jgi:hypothetical protein
LEGGFLEELSPAKYLDRWDFGRKVIGIHGRRQVCWTLVSLPAFGFVVPGSCVIILLRSWLANDDCVHTIIREVACFLDAILKAHKKEKNF